MPSPLPPILEIAQLLRRGDLTPVQLVESALNRIHSHEPQIHAWVFTDEEDALRTAQLLGDLLRRGTDLGPLHGIPIGIKDIVDVAGWPTLAGSKTRTGNVARQSAEVVTRLRRAGAVILGKTVTTEFACFDPPPTRNPWNRQHTPGGSSSGSAASVALEMCLLAVGSQTGGSIVRPASYCGVAGLKPSHGRVSAKGVIPISAHLDHVGPIARNVSDLAVGFSVMTGEMIPDLFLSPGAGFVPRLATIEPYFFEQADASLIAVTRQSLDHCRSAGAAITSLHLPPSFAAAHAMHYRLMAADAAAYHHTEFERDRAAFGPKLTELIDNGLAITGVQYSAALTHQRQFREELLGILPVQCIALTPSTPTAAPASLSTTGDPRFNSPWSFAGFPTVTIPCGLSPDGMPCGLQLIGRPGSEWELLTAAGWCESQIGFKSLDRTKE